MYHIFCSVMLLIVVGEPFIRHRESYIFSETFR